MFEVRSVIERMIIKCGVRPSHRLQMLLWYFELGAWLRKNPCDVYLDSRESLFKYIEEIISGKGPICYLEFGVSGGCTLRSWLSLNVHPESRFFGFDTFQGLPEPWSTFTITYPAGAFSTQGETPPVQDSRVEFVKGLFQDTLPRFLAGYTSAAQLVVHCDADLYSSTLYVLTMLNPILKKGSVLLFDDFSTANHDFRAFIDYVGAYRRSYKLLALARPSVRKAAVQLT